MENKTWTYADRYRHIKEVKIRHTEEKRIQQGGFMNADDYGNVPLPEDYHFTPIPADGDFIGYSGWAENFAAMLEIHPIYVDPIEILCGRWGDQLTKYRKTQGNYMDYRNFPEDRFPYDHLKPGIDLYGIDSGIGSDSHFNSDFNIGIALGWGGFLEKIRKYREIHKGDKEKQEFYDAEEKVVLAIQKWIQKHIDRIEELLKTEDRPEIRATLEEMLACNKNVISKKPETFLEACQYLAWFATVSRIYDRDGAGCWLDQLLYPFYKKDMESGLIDKDKARFILADLLIIDPHYYQLGGCDLEGNDMTNELSWLILEAAHELNTSANLTVRVHDNMDPAFFKKAVSYVFNDRNAWPRFSGHKGMMNYAKNQGVSEKDALERQAVGCGWSAVPGKEFCMNDVIKINCVKVFEVAFQEMMLAYHDAAPTDKEKYAPSLERLYDIYRAHLKRAVKVIADCVEFYNQYQHITMPELVMNLQMYHTLEEGKNISQCAEIYTLCCDGVGLGTLADSFAAIEQRIVREKKLTFEELEETLRNNFAGDERTRLMLSQSERYCQGGDSLGDQWAQRLTRDFAEIVKAQPVAGGKQLVPGWFSWSKTIHFGRQVGATPNGRKAGASVTHGANPTPGFRKDGAATAQATGIALRQPGYGNTAPLQIEFDPKLSAEEGGIDRVAKLLKTHIDMGGTLINVNVLDKDVLMEAHKDPKSHPELVVRVTGFTAYFCTLSEDFRQLVVDRFLDGM